MLPVVYTPISEKYFKNSKTNNSRMLSKKLLISISENPNIGDTKTGDLCGIYSLDVYHNQTNYELAYRISQLENGDIVVIIMAGTRENYYKELKRYMK